MEQGFCDIHKDAIVERLFNGAIWREDEPHYLHPHRFCDSTNNTPKLTLQLKLKSSVKLGEKSPWDERPAILSLSTHGHSLFILLY